MLTFGSLFSGIGGLDLGLERAGMVCTFQVEIDSFCRQILAKHWPYIPKFEDITKIKGEHLPPVDCLAGGFPCQDVSTLGKRKGIDGERSGLWKEFYRLICETRPNYVIVENVKGLLSKGFGTVLADLSKIGYDAEWSTISARDLGYPHKRERIFIIAYPNRHGLEKSSNNEILFQQVDNSQHPRFDRTSISSKIFCNESFERTLVSKPDLVGIDFRIPGIMDRLKALGNSVVPDCGEFVGRRLLRLEGMA